MTICHLRAETGNHRWLIRTDVAHIEVPLAGTDTPSQATLLLLGPGDYFPTAPGVRGWVESGNH